MKIIRVLLLFFVLSFSMIAKGQDDLKRVAQLPADHPKLLEAKKRAESASFYASVGCYTIWAAHAGHAMQLLRQAYHCYPVTTYDEKPSWAATRTDGAVLESIEKNIFKPYYYKGRVNDVEQLCKDTTDTNIKMLWEKVRAFCFMWKPEQLEEFYTKHWFEPEDSTEKALWKPVFFATSKTPSLENVPKLLEYIKIKNGANSPRYAFFLSYMATAEICRDSWNVWHTLWNNYKEYKLFRAIPFFQEAVNLSRELNDNMGYQLAVMSLCNVISDKAYDKVWSTDSDYGSFHKAPESAEQAWREADSLKVLESELLGEVLGQSNVLTQWSNIERSLFPHERAIIIANRSADPNVEIFAKGKELYRKGNYQEALEYFDKCYHADSLYEDSYAGYASRIWYPRIQYVLNWKGLCNYKLGKNSYGWFRLQPPIDRTLTKDIDYLRGSEPLSRELYVRILQIAERTLGKDTPEYAHMLVDAADYLFNSNKTEAFDYYSRAAQIYKEKVDDNDIAYSYVMERLAELHYSIGNTSACEKCMREVLDIVKNTGIDQSLDVFNTIIDFTIKANLHLPTVLNYEKHFDIIRNQLKWGDYYINNYIKKWADHVALSTDTINGKSGFERAFDVIENYLMTDSLAPKKEHYTYPRMIANQFYYLRDSGRKDEAFSFLRERISEIKSDWNRKYLLAILNNNKNTQEIRISPEEINLLQKVILNDKFETAATDQQFYKNIEKYYGIVELYDLYYAISMERYLVQNRRFEEAEKIWRWPIAAYAEAMKTIKGENLPHGTSHYPWMLQRHALLLQKIKQTAEATREMKECVELKTNNLLIELVMKNLQEREQYWSNEKSFFEKTLPSFVYTIKQEEMLGILYDVCLLSKGLLLNTEMELARAFSQQPDSTVQKKYQFLNEKRLLLTNQLELPEAYRTVNTKTLQSEILALEHDLKSALQKKGQNSVVSSLRTSWHEVEQKLSKTDAAVELLAIPQSNDSITYVALTLRQGSEHPKMTTLFEEGQLKALTKKDIYETNALFRLLWQPLEEELKGTNRIFFSPAGALHQVAIEYLPGMENRELFRLSSTRELVVPKISSSTKDVALYGGIQYELSDEERTTLQKKTTTTFRDTPDLRDLRGAARKLPVLEGSRKEVADISTMMNKKKIPTVTAMGVNGSEESFKALSGQGKSIIHISTHGFYQPAPKVSSTKQDVSIDPLDETTTQEDRSLSRSGLLLAGAADRLRGSSDAFFFGEDGILTAKEISRLDLNGLDLVVLSACETGLGDISGEGVFGLQRGFKKAGAQTLLMSLWKVEDEATRVLMTEFYRQLLDGNTKRKAFVAAQQYLRKYDGGKFNRWECWAAFVLLDGMESN